MPVSSSVLRTASSARSRSPRSKNLPNLLIPAPTTLTLFMIILLTCWINPPSAGSIRHVLDQSALYLLISRDDVTDRLAIPRSSGKRLLFQSTVIVAVCTSLRQRVSKFDVAGYGVVGHFPTAEIEYFFGSGSLTRLENDDQLDFVLGEFRWDGVGGRLKYPGVLVYHGLDLPRGNVLTPAPYRCFLPTRVVEIAFLVYPGQVARVEPAVL